MTEKQKEESMEFALHCILRGLAVFGTTALFFYGVKPWALDFFWDFSQKKAEYDEVARRNGDLTKGVAYMRRMIWVNRGFNFTTTCGLCVSLAYTLVGTWYLLVK